MDGFDAKIVDTNKKVRFYTIFHKVYLLSISGKLLPELINTITLMLYLHL